MNSSTVKPTRAWQGREDFATPKPTVEEATILIFGASGDLTNRKLVPALFALWKDGYFSGRSPIIGVARRPIQDEEFRAELYDAVNASSRGSVTPDEWQRFAQRLYYRQVDLTQAADFARLAGDVEALEKKANVPSKRIIYFATSPDLFVPATEALAQAGMIPSSRSDGALRVVYEKPFGNNLESAQAMSRALGQILSEEQIYRIDHYLGKETVQNLLLFRFGNAIFEPLFNRSHVDHVQITVAESQGIERGRGGYYDKAGALRDVLQNHLLQLLALVTMEPPAFFRAKDIHDEKLKVLEALAPGDRGGISKWTAAGQYTAGTIDGKPVAGYRSEERIPPDSRRETYVAMKVAIDNWRWAGVPFFLRTGKRLPERVTEVAVQFKLPPLNLFTTVECEDGMCDLVGAKPNTLVFRIQPEESISLSFSTKRPGMQYQIHPVTMNFSYESVFHSALPEAYERLLLDVLRGDSTLFTRSDLLEAAWRFVDPVLTYWEKENAMPEPYSAGTWGPASADRLIEKSGHNWRFPTASDKE